MLFNRLLLLVALSLTASAEVLMDGSGSLRVQSIPSSLTSEHLVAIISSPGTTASTLPQPSDLLNLESENPPCLTCRGPTLGLKSSDPECTSIAMCSLTAATIVLDGITEGDLEAGLRNSRHAVTLTALFRARVALGDNDAETSKQTLILYVEGEDVSDKEIKKEVTSLYAAAAAEKKDSVSFDKIYNLEIVSTASQNSQQLLSTASEAAQSAGKAGSNLGSALQEAIKKIQESDMTTIALDPPQIASAFVTVGDAHFSQGRSARAKIASWRSRVDRGLLVDGFGKEAEALRKRTLSTFDAETLSAAGLPNVATYRSKMRTELQTLVDGALKDLFQAQVSNLEKTTMKRLRAKLLKHVNNNNMDEASATVDNNAAALRAATFAFETAMEDLEAPALGLSKEKPIRDMTTKMNDELMTFPDSAAAKLKRAKQVKDVVKKEKKPSQRAIEFGLDLVAMLRPDGFGSLQGFAGYQLGGNSLTFGVHNDADDPQVIAQFGGVRPPLLRVQPKLRVDVEL